MCAPRPCGRPSPAQGSLRWPAWPLSCDLSSACYYILTIYYLCVRYVYASVSILGAPGERVAGEVDALHEAPSHELVGRGSREGVIGEV